MTQPKFIIVFLIITLYSFCIQAQDLTEVKELFSKTEAYYKNANEYSLKASYQFFEEDNSKATETLAGLILKNGTNYYSKIGPTEFIYIDDNFIKINHTQKAVLFSKITDEKTKTPVELSSLLKYFESVSISKNKGMVICNLLFKRLNNLPYSKMILFLDANDFSIKKQELYMLSGFVYPWQNNRDITKAGKVVISLNKQTTDTINSSIFNIANYIKGVKEISLSKKLVGYTLYK